MTVTDLYNIAEQLMNSGFKDSKVLWESDRDEGPVQMDGELYIDEGNLVIYRKYHHE